MHVGIGIGVNRVIRSGSFTAPSVDLLDLDSGNAGTGYAGTLTEGGASVPIVSSPSFSPATGYLFTIVFSAVQDAGFETFELLGDTIDLSADADNIGTPVVVGSTSCVYVYTAGNRTLLIAESSAGLPIPKADILTLLAAFRRGHTGTGANFTASPARTISVDIDGISAVATISLTDITEPILSNPGNQSFEQGEGPITSIVITNTGDDATLSSASTLPTGLTGSQVGQTWVISGTVDAGATVQTYSQSITGNNAGGSTQVDFDIVVTAQAPVVLKSILWTLPTIDPPESWEPTAPTEYAVPAFSLPSGTVHSPADSAELTTLLGGGDIGTGVLVAGDVISLDHTQTYSGNFWFPDLGGSAWTYVLSDAYASLPAVGTRATSADSANMAMLQGLTTGAGSLFQFPAINIVHGASKYRFVGIKSTPPDSSDTTLGVFQTGYNGASNTNFATDVNDLPEDIIIDRCYMYGRDATGKPDRYGVIWNVRGGAIIDSTIIDWATESGAESNAIFSHSGGGVYLIDNNELTAAGENIIFGGTDSGMSDPNPHDVVIRKNWIHKKASWFPSDPSFDGYDRIIKNLLEFKKCKRAKVYGNIFEDVGENDAGQVETGIVLTVRNQGGSDPDAALWDVDIYDNVIRRVGVAFRFLSNDAGASLSVERVHIHNNLVYDIGAYTVVGRYVWFVGNYATNPAKHVVIDHNTFLKGNNGQLSTYWQFNHEGSDDCFTDTVISNNVCEDGRISGTADPGPEAAMNKWHVNWNVFNNVGFDRTGSVGSSFPTVETNWDGSSVDKAADPPATPDADDVQFVDYASENFRLTAACAYSAGNANDATDGTDLGADIDQIELATAGALSGDWS